MNTISSERDTHHGHHHRSVFRVFSLGVFFFLVPYLTLSDQCFDPTVEQVTLAQAISSPPDCRDRSLTSSCRKLTGLASFPLLEPNPNSGSETSLQLRHSAWRPSGEQAGSGENSLIGPRPVTDRKAIESWLLGGREDEREGGVASTLAKS